ncbi:unnamed protein product [Chondrus crispus]|uniref:Uncharacterized protein n=1 Tax=Chondrus crispus TaxID=2769 RepID=R7QTN5_CHOCR|nr:unnamed protein product [Chondrus crispus]XP_005711964.1 unnamed protein product [Chondrus crispus]CDF32299.1 unnamed protein product [Chondrus crispus]CDF41053.1 unnamed protein product [Chondrus crispus]|eukprot:XP_005711347.1 unnamed protein product [Chondrus crispus]
MTRTPSNTPATLSSPPTPSRRSPCTRRTAARRCPSTSSRSRSPPPPTSWMTPRPSSRTSSCRWAASRTQTCARKRSVRPSRR